MLKSFLHADTFTPFGQMLIFEEQLSMSNMYFYICTDQAQINSADKNHLALRVLLAKIKLSDFWN
jgi:hypothetical protein